MATRIPAIPAADDAAAMLAHIDPPASAPPRGSDAATAASLIGASALQPTGPVRDALAAGRLLRSRDDATLDRLELILREGPIDRSETVRVGAGINGPLSRVRIGDPLDATAAPTWAVEKSASAQAAQEELGWRVARRLRIDHLIPAAIRRADGTARIEFRPGIPLGNAGIWNAETLEAALYRSYAADATLQLTDAEARAAARFDRQLLQFFDYLLSNNDRHGGNGLFDEASGVLSFIDSGHAGRGSILGSGGSTLEPAMRSFQGAHPEYRVSLDPDVVAFVRHNIDADALRTIHASVFDVAGIAGPQIGSLGERALPHVRDRVFREGMVARLDHVLEHGGYTHRVHLSDNLGEMPDLAANDVNPVGFRAVRAHFNALGGFGGFGGGFDRF